MVFAFLAGIALCLGCGAAYIVVSARNTISGTFGPEVVNIVGNGFHFDVRLFNSSTRRYETKANKATLERLEVCTTGNTLTFRRRIASSQLDMTKVNTDDTSTDQGVNHHDNSGLYDSLTTCPDGKVRISLWGPFAKSSMRTDQLMLLVG